MEEQIGDVALESTIKYPYFKVEEDMEAKKAT